VRSRDQARTCSLSSSTTSTDRGYLGIPIAQLAYILSPYNHLDAHVSCPASLSSSKTKSCGISSTRKKLIRPYLLRTILVNRQWAMLTQRRLFNTFLPQWFTYDHGEPRVPHHETAHLCADRVLTIMSLHILSAHNVNAWSSSIFPNVVRLYTQSPDRNEGESLPLSFAFHFSPLPRLEQRPTSAPEFISSNGRSAR
jgi:hypothetical protein